MLWCANRRKLKAVHPAYRPDVDGLRAIAVLAVLVYHLNPGWLPGGFTGVDVFFVISGFLITKIVVADMQQGQFSFWGFYARRMRRIFPALFVMLLASAAVAYAALPHDAYRSFFNDFKFAALQVSNFRFMQEVDYLAEGAAASPLLHTWSLAVEEQFYLLWPLLLLAFFMGQKKYAKRPQPLAAHTKAGLPNAQPAGHLAAWRLPLLLAGLAVCSLGGSQLLLVFGYHTQAFYMVYSRAFELALGGLVAVWPAAGNQTLATLPTRLRRFGRAFAAAAGFGGLLMVACAFVFITPNTPFPGLWALLPAGGAALVIAAKSGLNGRSGAATPPSKIIQVIEKFNKIISFRPFVAVGLISYSLYLWHWPLILFYQKITTTSPGVAAALALTVVSFVLAFLSWHYVEKPFRRAHTNPHKVVVVGLLLMLLFLFAGQFLKLRNNTFWQNAAAEQTYQRYFKQINIYHKVCVPQNLPELTKKTAYLSENPLTPPSALLVPPKPCTVYANPHSTQLDVLVIGDSHASHYFPAIAHYAQQQQKNVALLAFASCPVFVSMPYTYELTQEHTILPCSTFSTMVQQFIMYAQPKVLVYAQRSDRLLRGAQSTALLGLPHQPATWQQNLINYRQLVAADVAHATAQGRAVVLLGQVPRYNQNFSTCFLQTEATLMARLFQLSWQQCVATMQRQNVPQQTMLHTWLQQLAHNTPQLFFFQPDGYLSSPVTPDGTVLYYDNNHINTFGAMALAKPLAQVLQRALAAAESAR